VHAHLQERLGVADPNEVIVTRRTREGKGGNYKARRGQCSKKNRICPSHIVESNNHSVLQAMPELFFGRWLLLFNSEESSPHCHGPIVIGAAGGATVLANP